jgi:hypothetical protein
MWPFTNIDVENLIGSRFRGEGTDSKYHATGFSLYLSGIIYMSTSNVPGMKSSKGSIVAYLLICLPVAQSDAE